MTSTASRKPGQLNRRMLLSCAAGAGLGACSSLTRSPLAEADIAMAAPYGIPGVLRVWGDDLGEGRAVALLADEIARVRRVHAEKIASGAPISESVLALSGGGADGAFGAGLLAGWTEHGTRPKFTMVSGVSTGAIIGLLAFLGPDFDDELETFYTSYSTDELFEPSPFAALSGGTSLTDATGFNALVEAFVNDEVVSMLAQEAAAGRRLLIGTTNIDAARPVIWNVTEIAVSGHPMAKTLIRDVLRASAAIPAALPPVVIPVLGSDGVTYDEVHVDGGATQQVMLFSPELPVREVDRALGIEIERNLYVVINNTLNKPYSPVELGVLSIAGKAVSSLISGSGSGDLYKIYAIAQRDEINFQVLWIPKTFDEQAAEMFDPVYMRALYDLGFAYGLDANRWQDHPPFFKPDASLTD